MMTKRVFFILIFCFLNFILFGASLETAKIQNLNTECNSNLFYSLSDTCQPFIVQLNGAMTSHPIIDTFDMHVCLNDSVTFAAEAVFLDTNGVYNQTQINTKFVWNFADLVSDTNSVFSRTFSGNGLEMKLYGVDTIGCLSINEVKIIVKVSASPIVGNNSPFLGYSGIFNDVSVGFDTTSIIMIDTVYNSYKIISNNQFSTIDTLFIPDGSGNYLSDTIFVDSYTPNDTIASVNDILSIRLTLEHSSLDDLSITLVCPNGSSTILKRNPYGDAPTGAINLGCSNGGTNISLGCSNDAGSGACLFQPGMGWDYEFRPGATNCFGSGGPTIGFSFTNYCGQTYSGNALKPSIPNSYTGSSLVPAYYGTYETLSNLTGCPLNGNWILKVKDQYAIDNGFLFGWGIRFSDHYSFPPISYSLNVDSVSWYGNNITSTGPFTATIYEPNPGVYTYGTKIYDEYGCIYDTTFLVYCFLQVEEIEPNSMPIQFFPNPFSIDLKYIVIDQNWGNSDVNIYNVSGQLVYNTHISDQQNQFNLSTLASGNYILKVRNVYGEEYSVKIIVKK